MNTHSTTNCTLHNKSLDVSDSLSTEPKLNS